ncbi:MAG TPA: caspase family protein [bacterium]|nr:caspase family protein [bacterium]
MKRWGMDRAWRENRQLLLLVAILIAILLFLTVRAGLAAESGAGQLRRFAFIVGANDGGPKRVELRYAHTDAEAFAQVLRELGGVSERDSFVLLEPNRNNLRTSFHQMRNLLTEAKRADQRIELIFYYSGHSDENGLLLGDERYPYNELRLNLEAMPADVRIAVLDSCSSGAMTRRKGGQRRSAFLVDEATQVKGHAYLTSASANEAAQESDRIGGSFFTHYLVSGLRGAADASRDGRVTINEAYHYAFHETLLQTESTPAGPQHPNYDFQLAGSGDLVMTDLRETSSLLVLAPALDGRLYIRDGQGRLIAEINKPGGREMSVALEPGNYSVTYVQPAMWRRGNISLGRGRQLMLQPDQLQRIAADRTVARGNPEPPSDELEQIQLRYVAFSLAPGVSTNFGSQPPVKNYVAVNMLVDWSDFLSGFEMSGLGAIRKRQVKGVRLAGLFNYAGEDLTGVQMSGLVDIVEREMHGAQFGGLVSYTGKDIIGFQAAGLTSFDLGEINGMQAAGLISYTAGNVDGVQGAGLASIARRNAKVLQGSAVLNYTGNDFYGLQWCYVANVTRRETVGVQWAHVLNYSQSMLGLQTGLLNIVPKDMTGLQLGLINYSGLLRGLNFGLVNVAKEVRGESIGLFSYAGNGMLAPTIWLSDGSLLNAGLKMGSKHIYGLYGLGVHPIAEEQWLAPLVGLGGHLDLSPRWYLDSDVSLHGLLEDYWKGNELDMIAKWRVLAGYRFNDTISVYAGPTLNLMVSTIRRDAGLFGANIAEDAWEDKNDDYEDYDGGWWAVYPGFVLGVQFEPHIGKLNSR